MKKIILLLTLILLSSVSFSQTLSKYIIVDQFGYLPVSKKICVIKDPQQGFDADESYTPGSVYDVINVSTGQTAFTGSPVAWKSGQVDASSGDKTWQFNFSALTQPGRYYILDVTKNQRSFEFEISGVVYKEVLKHAMRSYFYQRAGHAKEAQFAGAGWADGASHIGPLQDKNCRLFSDKNNPAKERDLSGGWYDAGDFNKYTSWTANYVVDLMKAYLENINAWSDDYNIPESGNGVPDILDEAKWGIDFLLRMQESDGGCLSIVSLSHKSPPSSATGQSLYGPATTSASLNCAAAFAIASKVYRSIGMEDYADTLVVRAEKAWIWANANPEILFNNNDAANNSLGVGAGNQEEDTYNRLISKIEAACFLFEQTNNTVYRSFFDSNYLTAHLFAYNFAYPFEVVNQEALLYYTQIPNATASIVSNIKSKYKSAMLTGSDNFPAINNQTDPYGAHLGSYTWGSNGVKCGQGCMYYDLLIYDIDSAGIVNIDNAAQSYIHYIHGVNPLNLVYVSNMYNYGAENCVNEFYHTWFTNGSAKWDRVGKSTYGPPPGFMPGGANPSYNWASCCPDGCGSSGSNSICVSESISPPTGQPKQKSYKDFNTSWPLNSWEVTENSCGYQVNYIRLLSKFVDYRLDCNGDINGTATSDICGTCSGGNTGIEPETEPCNCTQRKMEVQVNMLTCEATVSPSGKYVWTESGIYKDTITGIFGCDSLLQVNLTIGTSTSSSINASACDSYRSPSGKTLTTSGIYIDTISNSSGCDSIISIDLKIGKSSKTTIYPVACQSYISPDGSQVWTNTGIYTSTLTNALGCDSVITVKLTIRNVIATASLSAGKITADASSGTFRWFRFSGDYTLIEGVTTRTYTPTVSGEYAVEVTKNGCTDTSSLISVVVTGIPINDNDNKITVYPNPSNGNVKIVLPNISSKIEIDLKNALGQTILQEVFYGKKEIDLNLQAPKGIYMLVVRNGSQQHVIKKIVLN